MKKSRFTEEQIAFALKQAETGTPVAEVLRPKPKHVSS
ncbi:transposase [Methylobacterium sp. ARG-1]